ncbi:MAG: glycosyltransferase [Clostridia bacterium]|nr:glycosyltransferase [Clostridia bacterium]
MKKILWIVNILLTPISTKLTGKSSRGVWIDPLLESFKGSGKYSLSVATTANIKETVMTEEDGVRYYALPSSVPILYDENNPLNIRAWKDLIDEEKPDLIQVWGTEFTHALCALREAKGIPSVIYMQGFIGSVARHYTAGMTQKELRSAVSFRDILKRDTVLKQQEKYFSHTEKEREMFNLSGRIISENDWCGNSVKFASPGIKVYKCPLSINSVFSKQHWDIAKAEKHSVICNASGYPLKGLHMILKAVAVLKEKYPDIKLYVPGDPMACSNSFKDKLSKRGYNRFIEKLIKELDIDKNIVWLGNLPQEELAAELASKRVFVLGSSIENHSSSLKEAMMVGVPCVASAVGGIPEYVRHGENGFLYRFEEYDIMAEYIEKLFNDDELSEKISCSARGDMIKLHGEDDTYAGIDAIYRDILNG